VRLGNYLSGNALITATPFIVDGVVLFSSHLGAAGATYRIEEVFPLA
jgi:2'-5' RNA ligase